MTIQKLAGGFLLAVATLGIVSTYVLWDDGRRMAEIEKLSHPAPEEVNKASYLDGAQFDWQSSTDLQHYRQTARDQLMTELNRDQSP